MTRRLVRFATTLTAPSLVAFTLACSDSVGPDAFAGNYELQRYEGQPLPAVAFQSPSGMGFIQAQRLLLGDDGDGIMTTTSRTVDQVSPQGSVITGSHALKFVVRGTRIEITYVCPPNANCVAGPHLTGERVDGGIALGPPASSKPASFYKRSS